MPKKKKPREIVKDAIVKLLVDDPFWACVVMRMKIIMTDGIRTLATDGKSIVIANSFTEKPFMELVAGLVHEACHVALKHNFRRGKRNFLLWNFACDYAINQLIKKKLAKHGKETGYDIPPNWLFDERFNGMTAEQIYDVLIDEVSKSTGGGGGQGDWKGPTVFDPNGSMGARPDGLDIVFDFPVANESERRTAEEMFDVDLQGIYETAKHAGKAPGFIKFEMESRHAHKIDYRELLRDWLSKNVFTQDYDWLTADRRFTSTGFHIPALVGNREGMPNILLSVDVSGSMLNQYDLPRVADEIQGVLTEFPGNYHVLYADAKFNGMQEISDEHPLKLEFTGGGGTCFNEIMKHIASSELEFDAILFFTDMETNSFGDDPGKPVLWMNTNKNNYHQPPFGRIIDIF